MKVYLAGPMRGIPGFNFPAFMAAAEQLEAAGLEVFNPAQNDVDHGFDFDGTTGNEDLSALGFSLRDALGDDLAYICQQADGVALLPGWENSSGARAEVATALALGHLVWEISPDLSEPSSPSLPVRGDGSGEVRVVASTGGEKGSKPQRFDLIPVRPLWLLAELYGRGAAKYEERNWERGYPWHLSFAAAQRHMWKFWMGEDIDAHLPDCPDDCASHTGLPHPICAVFHMFGLVEFLETHPEQDDRPL